MSNRRWPGLLIATLITLLGPEVSEACETTNGFWSTNSSVRIEVYDNPPPAVMQGIRDGAQQWNASTCNRSGYDFPKFLVDGSGGFAEARLTVRYIRDLSTRTNESTGSTVCALIDLGPNSVMQLFTQFRKPNGTILNCPRFASEIADVFAHELGHYLGLGHPLCSGGNFIMGPAGYFINAGNAIWDTNRHVQRSECDKAEAVNTTRREVYEQMGGRPEHDGPLHDSPEGGGGHTGGMGGGGGPSCYWHCRETTKTGLSCDLYC